MHSILKNSKLLAFCLFVFLVSNLQSQSLFEKLGGIKTDFIIKSDSTELNIISQGIIKNSFYESDYSTSVNQSYGYGYGVECYYLEFITDVKIKPIIRRTFLINFEVYNIQCFDESGNCILKESVMGHTCKKTSNENPVQPNPHTATNVRIVKKTSIDNTLYSYSINLHSIPMIILDKTKKIVIN